MTNVITADMVRIALAAMKPQPALLFYPGDWSSDAIFGCSIGAQGFWHNAILLVMHKAKPYGHMVTANGSPLPDADVVQRCGLKGLGELAKLLGEIEARGIPGRTHDADYEMLLRPASIEVNGASWQVDLSPLGIATSGVIYSRRMIRDRVLSLKRLLVSPKGQLLIRQIASGENVLTTQKLNSHVRAGAPVHAEDENEIEASSSEGVQGEGKVAVPDFAAAARIHGLLKASKLRDVPPEQMVTVWLTRFDETLIRETLADCEGEYAGKGWRYFEQILVTRLENPERRPAHRLKGKGNGNGTGATGRTDRRPEAGGSAEVGGADSQRPDFGQQDARAALRRSAGKTR